jgi:RNA polymerase sigma-70 factor (ECF subfamily)
VSRAEDQPADNADERLLAEFLAGNEARFRTLVDRYAPELFQFITRFVRNPAAAEDLVQETLIQVYQSAAGFDPSRKLRPWIFTIAANKARDFLRGKVRRKEVSLSSASTSDESQDVSYLDFLSDESQTPGDALVAGEEREQVRAIISKMPENLREILILGYYHQFPYKEIAEMLSIPLGTVKSRLHAAVGHFAAAYKKAHQPGNTAR